MAKQMFDVPDTAKEGKAVSDISKIFQALPDPDSIERVALAAGIICGFNVQIDA